MVKIKDISHYGFQMIVFQTSKLAMKKIIISLNNSPYRDSTRDFDYELFNAVDNKLVVSQIDFNKNTCIINNGRFPTNGEVGCTLSHISVLKQDHGHGQDWICVLEDDAITTGMFSDVISDIDMYNDDTPIMILLGHSKISINFRWIHMARYPLFNKIKIGSTVIGETDANLCGTVGYVANSSARKIISNQNDIFWEADNWDVYRNVGIKIFELKNHVVYEDLTSFSTTGNKVHCTNNIFKFPLGNINLIVKSWYRFLNRNV